MERIKTLTEGSSPRFKANNIADVLASRELFVDSYAEWYEGRRKAKALPKMYGPVHPSSKSVGSVIIPLVGHDPERDKPESLIDLITFALEKITIFDASAEMITELYAGDRFSRKLQAVMAPYAHSIPDNSLLRETVWTSEVRLNYALARRFGRPTANYYLAGVSNPNLSGGKPILTEEAALKHAGFGLKK